MSDGKTCSKCGAFKQLEAFSKNASSPDGRHSVCRECKNAQGRARRLAATPGKVASEAARLRLSYLENKEAKKARRKARYEENKQQILAKNLEWRMRNLDRHRELCRSWARNNPEAMRAIVAKRRASILGADGRYGSGDIESLRSAQGGKCLSCGGDLAELGYNVDHIQPLSRGGSNWPENLQLLCPACNRSKGAKLMSEWRPNGP